MNNSLIIKPINASETWPIRQKVMYPNMDIEAVKLPHDHQGLHLGLFKAVSNKIIGIVSIFIDHNELQFRKLAVLENEQGLGYGSYLLRYVFEYAQSQQVQRVWCNARLKKSKFYQQFGMISTDNHYKKNNIDFVIMEKYLE